MEERSKDKGIEEIEYRPSKGKSFEEGDTKMIEGKRVDLERGGRRSDWDHDGGLCIPGFWTPRMICGISCGASVFVVVVISILLGCSVHKIMEGTVGIYFRSEHYRKR